MDACSRPLKGRSFTVMPTAEKLLRKAPGEENSRRRKPDGQKSIPGYSDDGEGIDKTGRRRAVDQRRGRRRLPNLGNDLGGIMRSIFALVVVGCWSRAAAQTLSPTVQAFVKVNVPVVALTHVRVIDGTGAAAREDQTVILSHGKIESVSDAASASVPKDA